MSEERLPRGYCPVHEHEHRACTDYCLPERVDLAQLERDLSSYWYHRRRGIKPMSALQFRLRQRRD